MSADGTGAPLAVADTRITRRTARWDQRPAIVADAMDFWSFAAGAANVPSSTTCKCGLLHVFSSA